MIELYSEVCMGVRRVHAVYSCWWWRSEDGPRSPSIGITWCGWETDEHPIVPASRSGVTCKNCLRALEAKGREKKRQEKVP